MKTGSVKNSRKAFRLGRDLAEGLNASAQRSGHYNDQQEVELQQLRQRLAPMLDARP